MAAAIGRICGARLLKSYGIAGPQVLDIAIYRTPSSYAHLYKFRKCLLSYRQQVKSSEATNVFCCIIGFKGFRAAFYVIV